MKIEHRIFKRYLQMMYRRSVPIAYFWILLLAMLFVLNSVFLVSAQSISSRVVQVAVPGAVCATVQDDTARLVVGMRGAGDYQLAILPLDPSGNVLTGELARVVLPKTDTLKTYTQYPLDAVWHPRFPILYVWQDVTGPDVTDPAQNPVFREFNHLAVYTLTGGVLQLVQSYAQGTNYVWGQATGRIALDPEGKRLFLPNLRDPATGRAQIGYLVLNTNGLPIVVADRAEPAVVDVTDVRSNPSGFGFLAATDRVVIFSSIYGPVTWDTENRRAALNCVLVRSVPANCFVGGHPKLTAVFGAAQNSGLVYRVEQVDGFLTMLPQILTVPGAAFTAPPVVMPGNPDRVALGGVNKIHFLPLDATGRLTETFEELPVTCPAVQAMAYSRKFDRLYVAVEKLP